MMEKWGGEEERRRGGKQRSMANMRGEIYICRCTFPKRERFMRLEGSVGLPDSLSCPDDGRAVAPTHATKKKPGETSLIV